MAMQIGELAKRSGLAPSRLRFYERIGVLTAVERKANGYRTYPEQAVGLLHLITGAQQAGFSLDEVRRMLPADMSHWDQSLVREALRAKIEDIEALQRQLGHSKQQLQLLLSEIEQRPEGSDRPARACDILARAARFEPQAGPA